MPAGRPQIDFDSWIKGRNWSQALSSVIALSYPEPSAACCSGAVHLWGGMTLIRDHQDTRTCHSEAQGLCWGICQPLSHCPPLICLHLPPRGSGCHSFNGKLNYHQWPASSVRASLQQTPRHGERRCHAWGRGEMHRRSLEEDFVLLLMHSHS